MLDAMKYIPLLLAIWGCDPAATRAIANGTRAFQQSQLEQAQTEALRAEAYRNYAGPSVVVHHPVTSCRPDGAGGVTCTTW